MPNIPHNYSITSRAASLLGSQCCVLRYAAAPLTPQRPNVGPPVSAVLVPDVHAERLTHAVGPHADLPMPLGTHVVDF